MKKILAIAAAPVVLLLLSASAEAATDAPATQNQSGANLYCWKDKLYPAGNDLVCNWTDNLKDACERGTVSNVSKDSIVAEPVNAKRCENGEWLVRVTKK